MDPRATQTGGAAAAREIVLEAASVAVVAEARLPSLGLLDAVLEGTSEFATKGEGRNVDLPALAIFPSLLAPAVPPRLPITPNRRGHTPLSGPMSSRRES